MRCILALVTSFLVLAPTAAAQDQPVTALPEGLCQQAEAALMADQARLFCEAVGPVKGMGADPLQVVDTALVALPERSPFQALLLARRGEMLVQRGNTEQAERAFEEALSLDPEDPSILVVAIESLSLTQFHKDEAADHWLRLAAGNADVARQVQPETFVRLITGLDFPGQRQRALALLDGLTAIGYDMSQSGVKALVDSLRFRDLADRDDRPAALSVLARMQDPRLLSRFAMDNAYREYWPAIGWDDPARREAALRAWFNILAAEAANDPDRLGWLIGQLQPYVPSERLLAVYEAPFRQGLASDDPEQRVAFADWTQPLAAAHLAADDPAGAEALFELATRAFAGGPPAIRLALGVQHAELLEDLGRHADARAVFEPLIEDPDLRLLGERTIITLHLVRLRALQGLDQLHPGNGSLALMQQWLTWELLEAVEAHMQIGEAAAARDALRRRLRMDEFYPQALEFLQPSPAGVLTPAMRQREVRLAEMRADPRLRDAIDRRGRILPGAPILLADLPLLQPAPPSSPAERAADGAD